MARYVKPGEEMAVCNLCGARYVKPGEEMAVCNLCGAETDASMSTPGWISAEADDATGKLIDFCSREHAGIYFSGPWKLGEQVVGWEALGAIKVRDGSWDWSSIREELGRLELKYDITEIDLTIRTGIVEHPFPDNLAVEQLLLTGRDVIELRLSVIDYNRVRAFVAAVMEKKA